MTASLSTATPSAVPSGPADARPARRGGGAASGAAPVPAASRPVARVAVEVPLAHLDRPFDYLVPAGFDETVTVGARVRVRFAGRLVGGFVLDRVEETDHSGRLTFVSRAVSAEPVLSPEVATLARAVADRYAGTVADVLRLAVPPRHARVEAETQTPVEDAGVLPPAADRWIPYEGGRHYLEALARGEAPRAMWSALPGAGWPAEIADAVQATLAAGRGAVVVVPDLRDVARVSAAVDAAVGAERFVTLTADLGPAERYRRFLAVSRGQVRAVVGTRAAAFAPVRDLGLVVVWDDGDDLHSEPRAPYPHVRDVLVLRAHRAGAAALIGGFSPSVEAVSLVSAGWARPLAPTRAAVRATAPRVDPLGGDVEAARDPAARAARLPSLAWRVAREALAAGTPVLVQVPRRGYQPALACVSCRRTARCLHCAGPLARSAASAQLACRWCGRPAVDWRCPECGEARTRAIVVGDRRTAEELGRSFPNVPIRTSGRDDVLATVPPGPSLVVATPGAEPVADGGYGAVLLLDAWALLGRPDLRAAEEALRRWCAAAALARPATAGGRVVVTADAGLAPVQALIRWDPVWFARREADERAALDFPPATRLAAVEGAAADVHALVEDADLPAGADILGPVPIAEGERLLVRVPRARGGALATALKGAQGVRSARKATGVRVRLDPEEVI